MSVFRPVPLSLLIRQGAKGYDRDRTVFGIHRRAMFRGVPGCDMRQAVVGGEIGAPLGLASGPHTQLARNIAAGYLAGARWFELKTVRRAADRPDRPTIFPGEAPRHREWTHELPPREALFEFAKGMYLIEALRALFIPENLTMGLEGYGFDLSVYPESEPILIEDAVALSDRARDMAPVWDALRHDLRTELPRDLVFLAEIPLPPVLARSVTLSLDHGPRFEDVERTTGEWRSAGYAVRWKLPPAVLGKSRVRSLLDTLGYEEWEVVPERGTEEPVDDAVWRDRVLKAQAKGVQVAVGHGPHVGKAGEPPGYLSGRSLYPFGLAEALTLQAFGCELSGISFAGGIEEANYPEAARFGFPAVTLSSDLFRPGGLARLGRLHRALGRVMREEGADSLASYRARSQDGDTLQAVFDRALRDNRYHRRVPLRRDITSTLSLFDCVNCDLCIPVCPNGANFAYTVEPEVVQRGRFRFAEGVWTEIEAVTLAIGDGKRPRQQIGCEAEMCNDCGLCEAVCPEEGAPQYEKPRIFRTPEAFARDTRDGFLIGRRDGEAVMRARFGNSEYELGLDETGAARFRDGKTDCAVTDDGLPMNAPGRTPRDGEEVDMAACRRMLWILRAFLQREASTLAAVALEEDVW